MTTLAVLLAMALGAASPKTAIVDCNQNGVDDTQDIAAGTSPDCNQNGVPDECDTATTFASHVVALGSNGAQSVFGADLDGDGDLDVLAASELDDTVAWYENLDGRATFGPRRVISNVADGATWVFAADLDGDRDLDVLAGLAAFEAAVWYKNLEGQGTFGPANVLPFTCTGSCPVQEVRAADLDGDLDLDVVVSKSQSNGSIGSGTVVWNENLDGLGTFGAPHVIAEPPIPRPTATADFDGDGDLDVVVANYYYGPVEWAENIGLADVWPLHVVSQSDAASFAAADLDVDGDLDLVAGGDFQIVWYENVGGAFGPTHYVDTDVYVAYQVATADVDADGDLDVVSAENWDDRVAWYENLDGYGAFGPRQPISTAQDSPRSVFPADFDGDGDLDAAVASYFDDRIVWYENLADDCDGNAVPDACQADCNGNGIADPCDGDCNGNGLADDCDIAGGSSPDCTANGLPDECEPDCNGNRAADSCDIAGGSSPDCTANGLPDECEPDCNGNGAADSCDIGGGASGDGDLDGLPDECEALECTPIAFVDHPVGDPFSAISVAVGDIDADGDLDALGGGVWDGTLQWFRNVGAAFLPVQVLSDGAAVAWDVLLADLDGDGDPDAVSASAVDDTLVWYRNLGGSFATGVLLAGSVDGARAVTVADLDGDHDLDVVSAAVASGRITWHENADGQAGAWSSHVLAQLVAPQSVVATDIDGDGDADLVVGDSGCADDDVPPEGSGCCAADPSGGFSCAIHQACFAIVNTYDGFCSDVSWDGICGQEALAETSCVSCCFAGPAPPRLGWYENLTGAGSFGPPHGLTLADIASIVDVAAADLDGDGDPDLLAALDTAGGVVRFENLDGRGTFGLPREIAGLDGARSVVAADLDGDLDPEILVADGHTLRWVENHGPAAFGKAHEVTLSGAKARAVAVGDVDHDGDRDAVSADLLGGLTWFGNLHGDCNGNCVADYLEPDCDLDGVPDECELASGESLECNGDGVPDACQVACSACDADGDACADELDCALLDPEAWADPGPARRLLLARSVGATTLTWGPPARPGANALIYDVLSAAVASDFVSDTLCLESGAAQTSAIDTGTLPVGGIRYYLVRTRNACPGPGNLGTDSDGTPRVGLWCP